MKEITVNTRDGGSVKLLYYGAENKDAPLLVEIHGGGFMYGSARDDEVMCRTLADNNGVNVVSVDYRLAPEYVYPTATNDCEDALRTVIADTAIAFNREKIAVIGSSAGANLAVGLCAACKDVSGLKGQILVYPFLDCRHNDRKYVFGSFTRWELNKYNKHYFTDKSRRSEFAASPILGNEEDFCGLPQALVITAGKDTLRPDGAEYARLLKQYGVGCSLVDYPTAIHGYFESVPNGKMDRWWLSAKSKRQQSDCYLKTVAVIGQFLKEIFKAE